MGARRKREDETQMPAFGVGPMMPKSRDKCCSGHCFVLERWGKVFAPQPQHRQS